MNTDNRARQLANIDREINELLESIDKIESSISQKSKEAQSILAEIEREKDSKRILSHKKQLSSIHAEIAKLEKDRANREIERVFAFTLEMIIMQVNDFQMIEYYLIYIDYEYENISKEKEQLLVDAIRAYPAIRKPEHYRAFLRRYNPSENRLFLAPETWLPDSE